MKNEKSITFVILFFSLIWCYSVIHTSSNWKSFNGSSADDESQQINFYGTLITHQGQKDKVAHILIEGKHKDITMYDAPTKHEQGAMDQKTNQTEIHLDENPITDYMHTKIDLNNIQSIHVPSPHVVWVYQKEKKYQRVEFVLVIVTSKENVAKNYLMERKTHLSCNALNDGEQKKELPLSAVDTLTIEGYSFMLAPSQKKEGKEAPCTTKK